MLRHGLRRVCLAGAAAIGGEIVWEAYRGDETRSPLALLRTPVLPSIPGPALCDAPKKKASSTAPEYHAVPLPSDADPKRRAVVKRFKAYATGDLEEVAKFKKEKEGVKIYTIKQGSIPDPDVTKTSLPFARIGETVIKAPLDDVANLWWFFNARKDWDAKGTLASEVVEEYGSDCRLVYIKGAPKPMISSRDFSFVSYRIPATELGGRTYSTAFVQINAPDAVPSSDGAVRGNINSLIYLEPIDAYTTRARYVVEVEPKGWLPSVAVEAAADDLPGTLCVIKAHLEKIAAGADEKALVERRVHDRERDHEAHPTLVDSVTASEEDLRALAELLKKRLAQLSKDEKELGVSLKDLRKKMQEDLKKVEARLRAMKK